MLYWKEQYEAESLKYRKERAFLRKKEQIYDIIYYVCSFKEFCQTYLYLNFKDFTYFFLCAEESLRRMECEKAFGYCYRYYYYMFVEYDYPFRVRRQDLWRMLQIIEGVSNLHLTKDNLRVMTRGLINIFISFCVDGIKVDRDDDSKIDILKNV